MTELVLTAYDVQKYIQEALPALRAAIYRGDLSQVKDVLVLYDDALVDEDELTDILIEKDYSWVFTDESAFPDVMDAQGTLVNLVYPLILAYAQPDLFQMDIGDLEGVFPIRHFMATGEFDVPGVAPIQPGYREGLRAMWEILGYVPPEAVAALQQYCITTAHDKALALSDEAAQLVDEIAEGLQAVVDRGLGLVFERD